MSEQWEGIFLSSGQHAIYLRDLKKKPTSLRLLDRQWWKGTHGLMSSFGKQVDGTHIPSKYQIILEDTKQQKNFRNMYYLGKTQMNMKDEINIYKDPVVGLQYAFKQIIKPATWSSAMTDLPCCGKSTIEHLTTPTIKRELALSYDYNVFH